jgi:fimbrial chaperone protein
MNLNTFCRGSLSALCLLLMTSTPLSVLASEEKAGIEFYVLRVIYPEAEKRGVSLTAYNKTGTPYLMQSLIRPVDPATGNVDMNDTGASPAPFIVTPPLERLEANGELTLRIRRNDIPLPTDRESVYFISMKGIPSQVVPEKGDSTRAVLAVVNSLKVFYRPEGLAKRAVADVAGQLRFRRQGNQLIADNPTPYWLTFSRLKVGKTALDKAQLRLMVPPKGQRQYTLPEHASGTVEWQLIDEDGWDTPVNRQD